MQERITCRLIQARFKAAVVDGDAYFPGVCRYVDLNPARAGMVDLPERWPWSSYRAHAGLGSEETPAWLDSSALRRQLAPCACRREEPRRYAQFVPHGRGVRLWDEAPRGQFFLGGEAFVQQMRACAGTDDGKEIRRIQRRSSRRPMQWYFEPHERDEAISLAYFEGGYMQTAIAAFTALSLSRIGRSIKPARSTSGFRRR